MSRFLGGHPDWVCPLEERMTKLSLADEEVESILTKTETVALLRFCAVNSEWKQMINSNYFIWRHTCGLIAKELTGFLYAKIDSLASKSLSLKLVKFESNENKFTCVRTIQDLDGIVKAARYGLVLFEMDEHLLLCNPMRDITQIIPKPPFDQDDKYVFEPVFGLHRNFDNVNDDFCIVAICGKKCSMYSFASRQWGESSVKILKSSWGVIDWAAFAGDIFYCHNGDFISSEIYKLNPFTDNLFEEIDMPGFGFPTVLNEKLCWYNITITSITVWMFESPNWVKIVSHEGLDPNLETTIEFLDPNEEINLYESSIPNPAFHRPLFMVNKDMIFYMLTPRPRLLIYKNRNVDVEEGNRGVDEAIGELQEVDGIDGLGGYCKFWPCPLTMYFPVGEEVIFL